MVEGTVGRGLRLSGENNVTLPLGNFDRYQPFSLAMWIKTPDYKDRAVIVHRSMAWTDAGSRGYQLLIEDGKLSVGLIHFWPGNAIGIRAREPVPIGRWTHVAIAYDGSSRAAGLALYVDGRRADCEVVRDKLTKNITGGGNDFLTVGQRFRDRGFKDGLVDEIKVFDRRDAAARVYPRRLRLPRARRTRSCQVRATHAHHIGVVCRPRRSTARLLPRRTVAAGGKEVLSLRRHLLKVRIQCRSIRGRPTPRAADGRGQRVVGGHRADDRRIG